MSDGTKARVEVAAPVVAVTLLEDRATVTRAGVSRLEAGLQRLQVTGVAPVLVDDSLDVTLEASGETGATLVDARVVRQWTPTPSPEHDLSAILAELERTKAERQARQDTMKRAEKALHDVRAIRALWVAEVGDEVAWGRADASAWAAQLREGLAEAIALRESLAADHAELARLDRTLEDLELRAAVARDPSATRRCAIELEVDVAQAGEVSVRLEYLVPCAIWRPAHRAFFERDGEQEQVRWQREACVWQRTGEDWERATLTFSTERPSLGVQPPELTTDELRVQKRAERVEVEVREQAIATTGLGGDPKVLDQLPGVDDGGEPVRLMSDGPVRVPSDGRPHRIRIDELTMAATSRTLLVPELSTMAARESTQSWKGTSPLLAGPVDLVREGGLVGRTKVLFVAPGERFAMAWGPHPAIRVHREQKKEAGKSRMLSSWVKVPHRVRSKISNLSDEEVTLFVKERVPVSELREVEIEVDPEKTTGGVQPDEDGFLEWEVRVPARGGRTVELHWTLAKKDDVVGV